MALLDCGVASLSHFAMNYHVSGEVPQRRGNGGYGGVPSQAFRCRDGRSIFVVAGNDKQFAALSRAGGRPGLGDDERFAKPAGRVIHRDALLAELNTMFAERPLAEWLALLEAADVPAGPVNELPEVFEHPQVRHRGMLVEAEHPQAGMLKLLASPMRLSATPIADYPAPPLLGAHTREVLAERLHFSDAQIDSLAAQHVV
jgi:crotonobetainyl-CoA:carnitine CoA-transferase CaiB-like acyl-CoA transferase